MGSQELCREWAITKDSKNHCCVVLSHSVMSESLWSHGLGPARLLCSWGYSRQEYWSGMPCPPPGDLPNPGIEPRSPTLQQILYRLSHQGSPTWNSPGQKTGVGSLSLLQGTFPILGSNPGLPHCRWILYQLSHKGSPLWSSDI